MRINTYLLVWISAGGVLALCLILSFFLWRNAEEVGSRHTGTVETAQQILVLQATGLRWTETFDPRFFDWYPVTQASMPYGGCLSLVIGANSTLRRTCSGQPRRAVPPPDWFIRLYADLAFGNDELSRPVLSTPTPVRVVLAPEPVFYAAEAWSYLRDVGATLLTVLLVIGALVSFALRRALAPLQDIVVTLDRLGRGDHGNVKSDSRCVEIRSLQDSCKRLAADLGRAERERGQLWQALFSVQDLERESLALELHDEFGQHLSVIRANVEGIRGSARDPLVIGDAERIGNSAQHLMKLVRSRLHLLRPWTSESTLEDRLLELRSDISASGPNRPHIELELSGDFSQLPTTIVGTAFRIVQESLTNAVRHAEAGAVQVSVRLTKQGLMIAVSDDGGPCDLQRVTAGTGTLGIVQRARGVGGDASFELNESRGLLVTATLPVSEARVAA